MYLKIGGGKAGPFGPLGHDATATKVILRQEQFYSLTKKWKNCIALPHCFWQRRIQGCDPRSLGSLFFQVDKISGTLSVKSSLQTLALQAKISVVVQAVNTKPVVGPNANADAQSKTTVVVSFTDRDPPRFQNMKYTIVYVKEDVQVGSSVAKIEARASDAVLYSLQKEIRDRDNLPFTVDSASGTIHTSKTLDFEQKTSYLFAITAKLGGPRDIFSSAIVQINIEDVDDVAPLFGNDRYKTAISEATIGNTNVFRVKATDPDPINGGQIEYKIRQQYDFQNFTLTQESDYAQIKTRPGLPEGSFDRETKEVYNIIVEARRGEKLSTAFVSINVRDENDSPPIFKQKFYSVKVKEGDLQTPYIIPNLKVMAEDKDILENANVSYFITSGNDGRFEMRTMYEKDQKNYGNLYIVRPLDVEKTPEFQTNPVYNLTVTATQS